MTCNTGTLILLAAGTVAQGAEFPVWTFISDNYIQLISAGLLTSYAVATFVYIRSFSVKPGNREKRELAAGGQTGNMLYDWFIGRELNPRITFPFIGEVDVKEFVELRPGLMGWVIMNFAWCAQQYRNYGYITDSMLCITSIQTVYVVDSWWNESSVLTTMDITTDGFGMMLSFAGFAWEPFIYSLQTRYLAIHPVSLGLGRLLLMLSLTGIGLFIFRASNAQKDTFRKNPNSSSVSHLRYIQTRTGSKLLISGWYRVARHINYLGDWIQSLPYSLPTGLAGYQILTSESPVEGPYIMRDGRKVIQGDAKGWGMVFTYFYIIYFAVLLIHRDRRDDNKCHQKYGDDWEEYKKNVRWRIVPGIY